jgi:lysophospholipase L1-like esterase
MSTRRLLRCALVSIAFLAMILAPGTARGDTTTYYLALGDSLARGYMPGVGDTNQGYADDLYSDLLVSNPNLQLVKLGCSGETTGTMINGGHCTDRYPVGSSQLDAAVAFLKAHKGEVKYLTIDIGANDVDNCAPNGSIDTACVLKGVGTIATNLEKILSTLVLADGFKPFSIGMNYYDPFLAEWLTGASGQTVARESVAALYAINTAEATEYREFGFRVADVYTAFHTGTWTQVPTSYGRIPTNVAYVCLFTYMCTQQNIHPTVDGYQLISSAFVHQI